MKTKGSVNLSDEIKEKARVLLTEGYSINYISKVLKISRVGVRTAMNEKDNLDSLRQDKKEELIKTLWDKVKTALSHINKKKLKDSSAYQLMTIAAIGVDKAQLLSGEVTERVGLTMPEIDQRLKDIQEQRKILNQAQGVISRKGKQLQRNRKDGKINS